MRDLVEEASRGNRDAFDALAAATVDRLYAIAERILRDVDRAEDAVQSAFLEAWRDLPRLRDPDRFDAWLRRLLVHACYDEAKRQRAYRATLRSSRSSPRRPTGRPSSPIGTPSNEPSERRSSSSRSSAVVAGDRPRSALRRLRSRPARRPNSDHRRRHRDDRSIPGALHGGPAAVLEVMRVVKDPCGSDGMVEAPPLGPTVRDLVDWLVALEPLRASEPVPVQIAGVQGFRIDENFVGTAECPLMQMWLNDAGFVDPTEQKHYHVFEIDGQRVLAVTISRDGAPAADEAEAEAVLRTLTFR